jgi:hypothetical protein
MHSSNRDFLKKQKLPVGMDGSLLKWFFYLNLPTAMTLSG